MYFAADHARTSIIPLRFLPHCSLVTTESMSRLETYTPSLLQLDLSKEGRKGESAIGYAHDGETWEWK